MQAHEHENAPLARFTGYSSPNYTPIPDLLLDEHLAFLSEKELKVLLYICRRTFGFKKEADDISIEQMVNGIVRKDGKRLDYGTGLSRPSVTKAVQSLEAKNFIIKICRRDAKRGDLSSTYQLNVGRSETRRNVKVDQVNQREEGGVKNFNPGGELNNFTPGVKNFNPQETAKQKTEKTTTKINPVVVALTEWGISQNVSEALAKTYPPERISEKIEFLKYLIEHEPKAIKKPAAWLRKAIEENYGAPDGYKTANSNPHTQRQANAENKRKMAILEVQKAQSERAEQLQKEREATFTERLHKLFNRYQTSAADLALWEQAKPELANQGVSDAILASTQLLKLEKDKAVLHVINHFMAEQVAHPRVKEPLTAVLSKLVSRPLQMKIVVEDEKREGEGSG
jgi:DNA-binding MarR family transcriptional regulator